MTGSKLTLLRNNGVDRGLKRPGKYFPAGLGWACDAIQDYSRPVELSVSVSFVTFHNYTTVTGTILEIFRHYIYICSFNLSFIHYL